MDAVGGFQYKSTKITGNSTVSGVLHRAAIGFKLTVNPFTTGNPFLGTKLLRFSIGRGSGALKGLSRLPSQMFCTSNLRGQLHPLVAIHHKAKQSNDETTIAVRKQASICTRAPSPVPKRSGGAHDESPRITVFQRKIIGCLGTSVPNKTPIPVRQTNQITWFLLFHRTPVP